MRVAFIIFRLIGYAAVLSTIVTTQLPPAAWFWVATSSLWGIYDHLKRPDDKVTHLRLGAWLEVVLAVISAFYFHQPVFLFLLLSPVARTCVHLPLRDNLSLGGIAIGLVGIGAMMLHSPAWVPWVEAGSIFSVGSYSMVMGTLLRQRDRLRRTLAITVFEQEQRARDAERLRIATQLHDVMGQYWTAVIRALDVAEATDGEVHRTFLHRAREAAVDGLAEMRQSIQSWNQGRQSAEEWMVFLGHSIHRLRDLTGTSIELGRADLRWHRLLKPELTAEAIARVAVESTTNAIRHGHAERVHIAVSSDDDALTVLVTDNGIGLQSAEVTTSGTGMHSMEQLAASINGTFHFERTVTGTRVQLTVPYVVTNMETFVG